MTEHRCFWHTTERCLTGVQSSVKWHSFSPLLSPQRDENLLDFKTKIQEFKFSSEQLSTWRKLSRKSNFLYMYLLLVWKKDCSFTEKLFSVHYNCYSYFTSNVIIVCLDEGNKIFTVVSDAKVVSQLWSCLFQVTQVWTISPRRLVLGCQRQWTRFYETM